MNKHTPELDPAEEIQTRACALYAQEIIDHLSGLGFFQAEPPAGAFWLPTMPNLVVNLRAYRQESEENGRYLRVQDPRGWAVHPNEEWWLYFVARDQGGPCSAEMERQLERENDW